MTTLITSPDPAPTPSERRENPTAPELLTKKEVAQRLKVTVRTISKWQNRGWLPHIKIGGRCLYPWPEAREAIKRNFGHNF